MQELYFKNAQTKQKHILMYGSHAVSFQQSQLHRTTFLEGVRRDGPRDFR